MYKKNLNLGNCSLLLDILKSPLPTSPVILDFSYMKKETRRPVPSEFYLYPSNQDTGYSNQPQSLSLPVKRKLNSIEENDEIQNRSEKRRIISSSATVEQSSSAVSYSTSSASVTSNPTYATMNNIPSNSYEYITFCFNNNQSFFQPATEFDNFYFSTQNFDNVLYD
ncbi:hypothetical protein BpHYR1_011402 [Brachionus plicatilis]|uniref:Uncharacterized protein n=1 Tax=Brachionus plicatilis TaxID=10195 RepID=A0A3M7RQ11_BRAPC|nr:hypothetical protein BpHYR1_011402 [Brachionus plicatilis]